MQKDSQPRPTRGRPRAFDRNLALDRATRLFWQKGFTATSMTDLTSAMGIAAPSLYAAFGSKEDLYAEAIRYYIDSFGAQIWTGFQSALTVREAIEAYLMDSAKALTGSCNQQTPRGCMLALSTVGGEGNAELGEMVRTQRMRALTELENRFSRAVDEGEISASSDVRGLARYILAVQGGMALQARDGAAREELETVARYALSAWDMMAR